METQVLIKLTAIVGKMGIAEELKKLDKTTNEEVGKELIILLISNLYKVEKEVYELIASYKKISIEEAQTADIIAIIKELLNIEGLKDFLA
jgi:hypothetical protein